MARPARSCALMAVAGVLAALVSKRENTLRQYLRETVSAASATRDYGRRQSEERAWFAPRRAWMLRWWKGKPLTRVVDATRVGDRFGVLAVRVVDRGGALPVSRTVAPANQPRAWRGEWPPMRRVSSPAAFRYARGGALIDEQEGVDRWTKQHATASSGSH